MLYFTRNGNVVSDETLKLLGLDAQEEMTSENGILDCAVNEVINPYMEEDDIMSIIFSTLGRGEYAEDVNLRKLRKTNRYEEKRRNKAEKEKYRRALRERHKRLMRTIGFDPCVGKPELKSYMRRENGTNHPQVVRYIVMADRTPVGRFFDEEHANRYAFKYAYECNNQDIPVFPKMEICIEVL